MQFNLSFEKLINYDASEPGISLDVILRLNNMSINTDAKVDTGSTFCIFERKHGERLGFDIEGGEPQRVSAAVSSFLVYGHWVTLITENFEFDSMVFFAKDENFRRNVLGKRGWLDRVIIAVNDYEGKLYLSRYESE